MFLEEVDRLILFIKDENKVKLSYYFKENESNYRATISFIISSSKEEEMNELKTEIANLSLNKLRHSMFHGVGMDAKKIEKTRIEKEHIESKKNKYKKRLTNIQECWETRGIDFNISKQPKIIIEEYTHGQWMMYLTKKVPLDLNMESFKVFLHLDERSNNFFKKVPKEVQKTWLEAYAEISKNEVKKHFSKNDIFMF